MTLAMRLQSGLTVRLALTGFDHLLSLASAAPISKTAVTGACVRCHAAVLIGLGAGSAPLSPGDVPMCFPCVRELLEKDALESEVERLMAGKPKET